MSDQKLKPAVNTSTCLGDNETKVDLLNNEAIAETIIGLLLERQNQPITIGIHGDWGAGKSSILEMIEAGLTNKDDVLCLKFNGWRTGIHSLHRSSNSRPNSRGYIDNGRHAQ